MGVKVTLADLTPDNWEECIDLRISDDQEDNVDTNLYCIAEAKVEPRWDPRAVYAGREMVGMVVYGEISEGTYEVHHLMIGQDHQGKGYGKAAMREVIGLLGARRDCRQIKLSYWPGNPAVHLYESLGFGHTGETWRGEEPVMALSLDRGPPPS